MKYLLIFFFFTFFSYSQVVDDKVYSITYINAFKDRLSLNGNIKEYSRLMVNGNSSIYQIYNVMVLDTLKKNKTVKESDLNRYFSFNNHTIKINDNNAVFRDQIYEDEYVYKETLSYNWKLYNDTKMVNGYRCQKATTTYGGRVWEAWYAVDLPINAGPYKFKGLPGLILEISDSTKTYNFTIYAIVEKSIRPLEKYYNKTPESEWIKTDRTTFNKLKANFESLSLNEKLNYGNTGPKIKAVSVNGDDITSLRNPNKTSKAKDLNLIEVDY